MLTYPEVADTLAALLRSLEHAERVGVALLLAKKVLRDLPLGLRQETADEFAAQVRWLYDN